MTAAELAASTLTASAPPSGLSPEAKALWHAKKGNWDISHDIAQDIHTPMGSWIHALLHVIEGDLGNGNYWFHKARRTPCKPSQIDSEWETIAKEVLGG